MKYNIYRYNVKKASTQKFIIEATSAIDAICKATGKNSFPYTQKNQGMGEIESDNAYAQFDNKGLTGCAAWRVEAKEYNN